MTAFSFGAAASVPIEKVLAPSDAGGLSGVGEGPKTKWTRIVLIGASTGGASAFEVLLRDLPADCPPIVFVLHMPAPHVKRFIERLDRTYDQSVLPAENGVRLLPGRVLVAPGGLHTAVHRVPDGFACVEVAGPARHGFRPSVDDLFLSAVGFAPNVLGIIMTGLGRDGAEGLRQLRSHGAITIGQDRASCTVFGMPRAAAELGAVMHMLPLSEIPRAMCRFSRTKMPGLPYDTESGIVE